APVRAEGQIVAVVRNETLWTAEESRPRLLTEITRVVTVRHVVILHRHGLAPGVGPLEREAMGELLAHRHLHALVIGIGIERGAAHPDRLIAKIRDAEQNVPRRIRRNS